MHSLKHTIYSFLQHTFWIIDFKKKKIIFLVKNSSYEYSTGKKNFFSETNRIKHLSVINDGINTRVCRTHIL